MESLAGDGGMIPEQVWDADDIPERGLFKGRPSGSAMPLAWAHAEYLKLPPLDPGRPHVRPSARRRCGGTWSRRSAPAWPIWRFDYRRRVLSPGEVLRVETLAPAVVHWSTRRLEDEPRFPDARHRPGHPRRRPGHSTLKSNDMIELTFHWPDPDRWEGKNFSVSVV